MSQEQMANHPSLKYTNNLLIEEPHFSFDAILYLGALRSFFLGHTGP